MMTAVQPGQTYTNNDRRGGPTVRVERVDRTGYSGAGRPSAWVVDAHTGKRGRWVRLDALYTDGKDRRSGYRLAVPAAEEAASSRKPAVDRPWMVRRDKMNPRFPWVWQCQCRFKVGLMEQRCAAFGPATTEGRAHVSAEAHATDEHGYAPASSTPSH